MHAHLLWELQNCNTLLKSHWQENVPSHQKKIPHVHWQRRSPSKTVKGAKTHLNQTPYLPEMLRGLKQKRAHQDSWYPTRDWARAAFVFLSVSCRDTGELWVVCRGSRSSGCSRPGGMMCGIRPLGGDRH